MNWEVLKMIEPASRQNGKISCYHVCYTYDESGCELLYVNGVSHSLAMCN